MTLLSRRTALRGSATLGALGLLDHLPGPVSYTHLRAHET